MKNILFIFILGIITCSLYAQERYTINEYGTYVVTKGKIKKFHSRKIYELFIY